MYKIVSFTAVLQYHCRFFMCMCSLNTNTQTHRAHTWRLLPSESSLVYTNLFTFFAPFFPHCICFVQTLVNAWFRPFRVCLQCRRKFAHFQSCFSSVYTASQLVATVRKKYVTVYHLCPNIAFCSVTCASSYAGFAYFFIIQLFPSLFDLTARYWLCYIQALCAFNSN